MKLVRSAFPLVVMVVAACEDTTGVKTGPLDGTWIAAPEAGRPSGRYERTLTFRDGSFTFEVRSYGIYGGHSGDELSAYYRVEGTYGIEIEGNGIDFRPVRIVWWDRFYGANSPETARDAYPGETIFDDARYELEWPLLRLRFTTYPADAPEPALLLFTRAD